MDLCQTVLVAIEIFGSLYLAISPFGLKKTLRTRRGIKTNDILYSFSHFMASFNMILGYNKTLYELFARLFKGEPEPLRNYLNDNQITGLKLWSVYFGHSFPHIDQVPFANRLNQLAEALSGTQVRSLHMSACFIGNENAVCFIKRLGQSSVRHLDLSSNHINLAGCLDILSAVAGTPIRSLNLNGNSHIGWQGAKSIGIAIKQSGLLSITLDDCNLGALGARTLMSELEGSSLTSISLKGGAFLSP